MTSAPPIPSLPDPFEPSSYATGPKSANKFLRSCLLASTYCERNHKLFGAAPTWRTQPSPRLRFKLGGLGDKPRAILAASCLPPMNDAEQCAGSDTRRGRSPVDTGRPAEGQRGRLLHPSVQPSDGSCIPTGRAAARFDVQPCEWPRFEAKIRDLRWASPSHASSAVGRSIKLGLGAARGFLTWAPGARCRDGSGLAARCASALGKRESACDMAHRARTCL